ncbi:hypothetical protein GCM10019016_037350 [Streptomyces prasinosporus]|uniref:Major facilitator superfamily (MFS) profile domain-containing protein n=1 Tax=Streptomyces prasinosporus TaxID=68256 RepID=A0ABP6TMV9_9ACTN
MGLLVSYLVNWAFSGSEQRRGMFRVGGIPSALLVIACLWLPESPVWQINHGKTEEARRTLDRVTEPGDTELVVEHFEEGDDGAGSGRDGGQPSGKDDATPKGGFRALPAPAVRPALLVGMTLAALQQFSGINTILYYAPTIMGQAGLSASKSIYYSVFIGVINVVITLVSVGLVDRVGRRALLLVSLAGTRVTIALLGVAFAVDLAPILMLVFLLLYIVAFGVDMGPVFWTLLGELFPLLRARRDPARGATVNWFSNFVVSLLFLPLIDAIGEGPTFWIFTAVRVLGVAFVVRFVPETRGRRNDEVTADLHRRWNVRTS